jgi:putative phosphonate metabolism protein
LKNFIMSPRFAIYYTPPPASALARFGAGILGYDCFEAVDVPHTKVAGLDAPTLKLATASPRRYGFHATIVPPFHLNSCDEDDLIDAASRFATRTASIPIGTLTVDTIGDFIALTPAHADPRLQDFAARCLTAFQEFRAPLSNAERERGSQFPLTPRQLELLDQWGYPYVLDEYRFHMTLTGSLPHRERHFLQYSLQRTFVDRAARPVELDAISVMKQDDSAARFRVLRRCLLRG